MWRTNLERQRRGVPGPRAPVRPADVSLVPRVGILSRFFNAERSITSALLAELILRAESPLTMSRATGHVPGCPGSRARDRSLGAPEGVLQMPHAHLASRGRRVRCRVAEWHEIAASDYTVP